MRYEVILSKGLGELKFGMRPNDVERILGSDQSFEEWMGGNLEGFYFYKGLLIGFSGGDDERPNENSGVCIFTVKPVHELILWDANISVLTDKEIRRLMESNGVEYKLLSDSIIQSTSGKLQFNFDATGKLDELYFEQH
ncbi:MAG: hypothetical protein KUG73_16490 [Pseudomonadales bacterium]|nr:hypothetical protein [Pseudomonadales bacterium]